MSPRLWIRLVIALLFLKIVGCDAFTEARAARYTTVYPLVGIGAELRTELHSGQLLILTPFKGGPAHKAGLYSGDVIVAITREVDFDGQPLAKPRKTFTKGLPLKKAKWLLLGQEDTKVRLTIQREGQNNPFDVEITRTAAVEESVIGIRRKANADWDYEIDRKHKIGYIRLTRFARNSFREMQAAMKDLERQGFKGLVLDLRFNRGTLLDSAIKITDLFIDDGRIVSIHPRGGLAHATRFDGQREGSLLGFPMVCLINGDSASSSEIVSAALQDHKRAIIIGERSRGKGSVQNILDFDGAADPKTGVTKRAELKLTTASFYRPSGKNLDRFASSGKDVWGVTPDKKIPLTAQERGNLIDTLRSLEFIRRIGDRGPTIPGFKDRQLDAALEHIRSQIK